MKYHKYVLIKKTTQKQPVIVDDRKGSAFRNFSISYKRLVKDPKTNEDIWICNAKGYDVFTDPEDVRDKRLFVKPQFTNGILIVPDEDKRMWQYLDTHPGNMHSSYRSKHDRAIFIKWDEQEIARKNVEEESERINLLQQAFQMEYDSEIVPLLMRAGYKPDQWDDPTMGKNALIQLVKKSPSTFKALAKDTSSTERAYEIKRAQEFGIITYENGSWKRVKTGGVICTVPASKGREYTDYFVQYTFNDGANEWSGIRSEVKALLGEPDKRKEKVEKAVKEEVATEAKDYLKMSASELLQSAKDIGIYRYNPGTQSFEIGDSLKVKCKKDELAAHFDNSDEEKEKLVEAVLANSK